MKTALIAIPICIAVIAMVFAIPAIPIPVQRVETYTETVTKQEPYTVIEKQQVSTPHVVKAITMRKEFNDMNKMWVIGFKVLAEDILADVCTCDPTNSHIGDTKIGQFSLLCVADDGKIHVSWSVNENERGTTPADLACPPHFGFTNRPSESNTTYCTDKQDWQGEIEFSPNGLPTAAFGYRQDIAEALYKDKQYPVFLQFGYDCGFIGHMPPVNLNVDYIYYSTETVDKEVTKYRDVPTQVQKQRTVTDYQNISVWQRIFGK